MVRKARSEGSSLFCEWAIGSSINAAMRKLEKERLEQEQEKAEKRRNVIKLELTTDDESEIDSVRVTYPRNGTKSSSRRGTKPSSQVKQVRFEKGSLKPALKKKKSRRQRAYESSESDTIASETESGTDTTRRRKSHKSRRSKADSSGDSDAFHDSNCSDFDKDVVKKKRKSRRKYASDPESSSESESVRRSKEEKRRRYKGEHSESRKDDPVEVEGSDTSYHGDEKSYRRKEWRKHQSKGDSPKNRGHTSSKHRKSDLSSEEKAYPEAMPGPHPRRPNLIRPIRAEVMQVEHTVEGPEDPRPNAFVDERNNIVRVYHGPAYGNPFGKLYPRRDPSVQPLPVGVPHPMDNKYYYGFRNSQDRNHSHSREGHMPTTLGDPYSSIPAQTPINSAPAPEPQGNGPQDLTSGLWGIGSGPSNITKDKAPSWTNNVGPLQPSTSLGQANPGSRWAFGSSKKKDDGDGSAKNSCGDTGNNVGDTGSWGAGGGDQASQWGNNGGDINSWGAGGRDRTPQWGNNGGGDDPNQGNADDNWDQGNNDAAWGAGAGDSTNQEGGSTWGVNENAGDGPKNQSPSQWDGQNNDMSWGETGNNDNSWGDNNNNVGDTWGGANNNNTWEGGTDNASNNVGPPGNPSWGGASGSQNFSPAKHVPGSWEDASQKPFPSWGDPTAAQSAQNQQGGHSWFS